MTKRAEAKYKIDRRMGENIWGRPRSPFNKREYGPGQHGQRRKGKATDFGTQLKAKQKVKGYYGNISERQFHKYYVEALRLKGDSSANLIGLLERRLDAVIYRAKFVPTVFAARQFINHGHIRVNGRRVNIASYQVKVGDLVEIKESSRQLPLVMEARRSPSATCRTTSRSITPKGRPSSPASPAFPKCPIRRGWSRTSSSNSIRADAGPRPGLTFFAERPHSSMRPLFCVGRPLIRRFAPPSPASGRRAKPAVRRGVRRQRGGVAPGRGKATPQPGRTAPSADQAAVVCGGAIRSDPRRVGSSPGARTSRSVREAVNTTMARLHLGPLDHHAA